MGEPACLICQGPKGDRELGRTQVWQDGLWRLTSSLIAPVPGFSYLEPKRHIPDITELDGPEAQTLGNVLALVTRLLREETGASLVYVNVFGERIAHLHFNLAPHHPGDPLRGGPGMLAEGADPLPEADLRLVIDRVRQRLADKHTPDQLGA
jgi:diadenosine tetraphosphate (Ap4A) HIT family hydrolase